MSECPVLSAEGCEPRLADKLVSVAQRFEDKFGCRPHFAARVPGRVNLIGEHIDYCGYGVLPMAVDEEVIVAVGPTQSGMLELSNVDSDYEDFVCSLEGITIDNATPDWYKYFLCGVKGIAEHSAAADAIPLPGFRAMVHGSVPPCSGLSSSSALVCSAALATAHFNLVSLTRQQLADTCAKSECFIGTEGGGMDQAIAILATKGSAKYIQFNPLRANDTKLPPGAVFVVANSLAESNKAAGCDYNCRVTECRLAAKVLAKLHGVDVDAVHRLCDVQASLNKTLSEMAQVAGLYLHDGSYTKEEVSKLLGITVAELENRLPGNTRNLDNFKLRQRALHVYREADRVCRFKDMCDSGDASLEQLGQLMTESHESCRDLYECSHPQVDQLVQLSVGKSLGARLTGAGWGGCIVAMVREDEADDYIAHLKTNYFDGLAAAHGKDLNTILFKSQPGGGAAVYLF